MSKKNRLKVTAAACLALAMTFGTTACDAFLTTDNEANMKQVVASVNISSRLSEEENAYAQDLQAVIDDCGLVTDVPKRDLVAFFMSQGYQYVQNYGYTYEKAFELLLDTLVNRKVLVQHAIAYYLAKADTYTKTGCAEYVTAQTNAATGVKKTLLEKHPEVLTLKYFLTKGGQTGVENEKNYDKAVYALNKSINDSLDKAEKQYIKENEHNHDHGEVRTKPTGAGTEKEEYYIAPVEDMGEVKTYQVYTGRNDLSACYGYEKLDGSTKTTRIKAYNSFLKNLQSNSLILEGENTTDFTKMDYYYVELGNQLEAALITQYTDDLEKQGEEDLHKSDASSYVAGRYAQTLAAEEHKYTQNESGFETAIGALSDEAFALYSPKANYGFVYNILIPFTSVQNDLYTAESKRDATDTQLAAYRAQLLTEVKAKDLRTSWFSDYEDENYAYEYNGTDIYGGSKYLFFEDNFTNSEKYEDLGQYYGKYAFNGTVTKNDDDEFVLKANKMDIDAFIAEMEGYMSFATGLTVSGEKWSGYVTDASGYDYDEDKKEFNDYSQFMYYTGRVGDDSFKSNFSIHDYFVKGTDAYNAVSAFNELMFAYSTDKGCLNTYMGYVVSPYKTSYVSEFEYAAQYAIRELGVGGYVVCPSTYGWHVIYVSYVYGAGEVYEGGFNAADKDTEGTFSQLYFEMVKNSYVEDYASEVKQAALKAMKQEDTITRYPDRYKDLTSLDR